MNDHSIIESYHSLGLSFTYVTKSRVFKWCNEAIQILQCPNAGGQSNLSEALAFQYLYEHNHAQGAESEMNIQFARRLEKM